MSAEETLFNKFGKEYPKGTVLVREGEPGKEMYVIQAGRVRIWKQSGDVEKLLAVLGPGEFFGEMAIISNKPRSASATVEEDCRLLIIDPRTFEGMIRGNAEIAVRMIKKMADRLADADAQIDQLLQADPVSRVVKRLTWLNENRGKPTEEGVEVDFQVREVSKELGVGEPALRLIMLRMASAGLIEQAGDRVTIPDVARLFDYLRYLEMKWKFGEL